jgi:hypothetical protein
MKRLIFLFSLFLFACNSATDKSTSFKWLEGKWQGKVNDSTYIFENWNNVNQELIKGTGGMCIHSDTVFSEKISIYKEDNNFYYRADVSENEEPIDFLYKPNENDSVVFENLQHDFPQRIVYYYKTLNKLYAHIEGTIEGKYRKEIFEYEKK